MLLDRRLERNAFVVLATLGFIQVCLRAIHVPLTHDEAVSFFQYARTGAFQPGYSHWDAGNHLLNSAFGHVAYLAFGMAPGAIRSGSVLCYVLYAVHVWRTGRWVHDPLIRVVVRSTLLLTPFVLDFFSLLRGYGPSLAFGLMGVYYLVSYTTNRSRIHLLWTLVAFTLAGFASLNILFLWMQAMVLVVLFALAESTTARKKFTNVAIVLVLGLPPLLYSIWYAEELKLRDMLYYGSNEGLIKGTLGSLSLLVLGTGSWPVVLAIAVVFILTCLSALFGLGKNVLQEGRWLPLRVIALCLVGELVGRTILWEANGVLFPMDRTAAHLVPMALILFALALDRSASRVRLVRYAALPLLLLPMRTLGGLNLERTALWPEEHLAEGLFKAVQEKEAKAGRPLLISAWSQHEVPWLYAKAYRHPHLVPLTLYGYPLPYADLILRSTQHTASPSGYVPIYSSPDSTIQLLERIEPLVMDLLLDTVVMIPDGAGPINDLWEYPMALAAGKPILLEVTMRLNTGGDGPVFQLVCDAKQADGTSVMYEGLELQRLHQYWNGEIERLVRYFPPITSPEWAKLYLWKINGRTVEGECRVRTFAISL